MKENKDGYLSHFKRLKEKTSGMVPKERLELYAAELEHELSVPKRDLLYTRFLNIQVGIMRVTMPEEKPVACEEKKSRIRCRCQCRCRHHEVDEQREHRGSVSLEDWLDGAEVMRLLRISHRTLQTWRMNQTLPFSKIGGKCYYLKQDILALLNNNRVMFEVRNKSRREGVR